ncbi:hypothetical protein JHU72_001081 [Salmonella enterica]|uniref:Uncharacterized protein n=1 Tax=Salmonella enterica TaxID=28901 RepID=A0A5Y4QKB6_SALER|nr:hypothetical protein [Salmonella enterica]EAA8533436.1 hypothetical protein [Salmonella enterica subsp. enterica serovar Montevideo]ECB4772378.1 hypothetical protein [Salmonella enterica subsp. enterica serovar Montevideo]ECC1095164.1 hypothetical protein [Salmonella enterica subsp. enterica serovar Montevideo]ECE3869686.1 hypothetical protein [Salmonella enterica]ECK0867137.1 hypothetical protein [Salmonella enterica subsp. enterica serovar Montevideo]
MQQVKIYTASPSDLSPPVQSESFCVDLVLASDYRELEAKCAALVVENGALKKSEVEFNDYCRHECEDVGDTWVDDFTETPATDAFLAEVRASAIPEGYALVPQQIFLEPSDIELICSQCGDGHESGYGDFTDGLLWVGNIQRDDGRIVHGLHISSADYTEEGGVTVCEFAAQPRKGGAV